LKITDYFLYILIRLPHISKTSFLLKPIYLSPSSSFFEQTLFLANILSLKIDTSTIFLITSQSYTMDSRQFRQTSTSYSHSLPSRALYISRPKSQPQPEINFDFTDKMARAKAAMLAMEQQNRPTSSSSSIPEIVITPSLEPIVESDDEK